MQKIIRCQNFQGVAVAEVQDKYKVAQLRCKQWHCPYCAKKNAEQWRASLIDYMVKNPSQWCFITITLPSWIHKLGFREDRVRKGNEFVRKNWDKLMKRIRRWLGKIQYIRVVESHLSGVPHIHLLIDCWIDEAYTVEREDGSKYGYSETLEKHLKACEFGYVHDVRNLETEITSGGKFHAGSVATYVTKYITKDLADFDEWRKKYRVRKIQTSRRIKRVNLDSNDTWERRLSLSIEDVARNDKPYHDVTTGLLITLASFRGHIIYPPELAVEWERVREGEK